MIKQNRYLKAKRRRLNLRCLCAASFLFVCSIPAYSQDSFFDRLMDPDLDSSYVVHYDKVLTTRGYLAQKYTRFSLSNSSVSQLLDYKPENNFTVGIGASYEIFTLNIGIPLPATLNPVLDNNETSYIDIQSSIYTSKVIIDLFGQFYKGMYLNNTSQYSTPVANKYYIRPDIYTQLIGISGYYLFNHSQFSYRAATIQNQRQLKSAGTFLVGLDIYHGLARGDSAFVPGFVENIQGKNRVDELRFFRVGPGGGYAHTFVFWDRFFYMLSITANAAVSNYKEFDESGGSQSGVTINPGLFVRSAVGYNSEKWFFGIAFSNNAIINLNNGAVVNSMFSAGAMRFTAAYRFELSKKTNATLKKILPLVK